MCTPATQNSGGKEMVEIACLNSRNLTLFSSQCDYEHIYPRKGLPGFRVLGEMGANFGLRLRGVVIS